jgi:hypothetical protein
VVKQGRGSGIKLGLLCRFCSLRLNESNHQFLHHTIIIDNSILESGCEQLQRNLDHSISTRELVIPSAQLASEVAAHVKTMASTVHVWMRRNLSRMTSHHPAWSMIVSMKTKVPKLTSKPKKKMAMKLTPG